MSEGTTLDEFLRTGQIGFLKLGLTAKEVAGRLGLPDDIDDSLEIVDESGTHKGTHISYGVLHLTFIDNELWYMIIDVHDNVDDVEAVPAELDMAWLSDLYEMNRADFAAFINAQGLVAYNASADIDEGIALRVLMADSSTMLLFDLQEDHILTMHKSVAVLDESLLPRWPA